MWRLIYPLQYFRLSNSEKRHIDFWPTVVIAILIMVPFVLLKDASFFRPNGFLDKILTLTAALTGFYVAALVAAATFSHPDLDKVIKSGPIALLTKDADGNRIKEYLTRREFACTIFGYLAFLSLIISIMAAFLISISAASFDRISHVLNNIKYIGFLFSAEYFLYLRGFVIFAVSLAISHLFVATCLGLYYLMDRLYRHDRQITTKKTSSEAA
jgi:hypothetical protein